MRTRIDVRSEQGQSLVLFALALPLVLGVLALAVEGAHAFGERRQAQNAADAGALAAAQMLSSGPQYADVEAMAADYVARNLAGGATTTVSWPYVDADGVPHDDRVEVAVKTSRPTFLARVIGVFSFDSEARAVASGPAPPAQVFNGGQLLAVESDAPPDQPAGGDATGCCTLEE